ncbi:hypothetical protein [Deinococcus humi]|uniref:DUF5666 domain-containing protein n=1 Tax=Deinococcus humi TaxID=662880 RepID=A0A7W8JS57_9DEIO|nr:hypothetical protein [Deinococcus humi]MBB5362247.1 hypothetical protein [Deinococcus humi]GGO21363.1 hypothetical protein GCM10008949_07520 [Deinococcus humi]
MKNILLILLTGSMLAACTPKSETTTTTETTTTDAAVPDTTVTDTTATDATTTTDDTIATDDTAVTDDTVGTDDAGIDNPIAEGEGATDDAADPGVDSTLTNADDANASEETDMAVGDGLEGTVTDFDGTAQTFTLNENDANYAVTVTPDTVFEGTVTTAEEFFGTDRANANVAVEGEVDSSANTLTANKITLN